CWFCKFGQPRESEPVQRMSWPLIERIVANLQRLEYRGRLSWYKINEPLLDKRLEEILQLSRTSLPDCWLSLVSNGDLLTEEKFHRLLANGLDVLGVSVYDDEVLHKIRQFEHERLIVLDRRPGAEGSFVENRGGNIQLLTDDTRERNARDVRQRNCLRPSTMMSVQPDGRASLCCCDLYGDIVVGDVNVEALEQIWWGDRLTLYRATLRDRGRSELPLCASCTYDGWPAPRLWPLGFGTVRA
ncbi:MAG: SPASM domain-containing protein, partial [Pirellulaceae bacterium]